MTTVPTIQEKHSMFRLYSDLGEQIRQQENGFKSLYTE